MQKGLGGLVPGLSQAKQSAEIADYFRAMTTRQLLELCKKLGEEKERGKGELLGTAASHNMRVAAIMERHGGRLPSHFDDDFAAQDFEDEDEEDTNHVALVE